MSRQALALIVAACIAALASPAPAQGLFDSPVQIAQAPITKLPAGGLFGSLLASNGPTAECTCTDCKCANCGCTITTASEEEVVAAARAADQNRYIYTAYADGSWRAVPRATTTSRTTTTTAYEPVVVRSEAVCANGQCYLPSSYSSVGGTTYSESRQSSYSYSGDTPYTGGRYTRWFSRRGGGGRGMRLFGGGCASGQCGR